MSLGLWFLVFLELVALSGAAILKSTTLKESALPPLFHGDLVVFGNSLSDDGIRTQPPEDLFGIKRFCNGPVWPEYLSVMLGVVDSCGTMRPAINNAHAGAKIGQDNYYFQGWSGVLWQVETFLNKSRETVNPNTTIFFIEAGINDLFNGDNVTVEVVDSAMSAINSLAEAGFKNLVVFTIPDLGWAPGFTDYPDLKDTMSQLGKEANEMLAARVAEFLTEHPPVHVVTVDFDSIWPEVEKEFAYPKTAFDHHTMNPGPQDNLEYAWYDAWHPATGVHEILAVKVAESLREEFGKLLITPLAELGDLCMKEHPELMVY